MLTKDMQCPDCGRDYSGVGIYKGLHPGMACPADDCASNEAEEMRRGQMIVDILGLRPAGCGYGQPEDSGSDSDRITHQRYATTWGSKTALGLFRTVKRIIEEGK